MNILIGDIKLEHDGVEYILRPSFKAMANIESTTNKDIMTLIEQISQNTRLLRKFASDMEIKGEPERRDAVYKDVHEDSSTESTYNLPAEVELPKKSTISDRDIEHILYFGINAGGNNIGIIKIRKIIKDIGKYTAMLVCAEFIGEMI